MFNPYEWIWKHTTDRPYSFILRDSHSRHPIAWIIGTLLFGVLMGHVFWSTSQEENERYG